MIISNKYNMILPRIPKTGSTTLTSTVLDVGNLATTDITNPMPYTEQLARNIVFNESASFVSGDADSMHFMHITPAMALEIGMITENDIADMTIYCMIRHPFTRWLSGWRHARGNKILPGMMRYQVSISEKNSSLPKIFAHPMVNWTHIGNEQIAELLLFEDYETEIYSVLSQMGVPTSYNIQSLNVRAPEDMEYTPDSHLDWDIQNRLAAIYAEDLDMWTALADAKNYMGDRWA